MAFTTLHSHELTDEQLIWGNVDDGDTVNAPQLSKMPFHDIDIQGAGSAQIEFFRNETWRTINTPNDAATWSGESHIPTMMGVQKIRITATGTINVQITSSDV